MRNDVVEKLRRAAGERQLEQSEVAELTRAEQEELARLIAKDMGVDLKKLGVKFEVPS